MTGPEWSNTTWGSSLTLSKGPLFHAATLISGSHHSHPSAVLLTHDRPPVVPTFTTCSPTRLNRLLWAPNLQPPNTQPGLNKYVLYTHTCIYMPLTFEENRECLLCLVAQLCPTLCDPTEYSLPGSSVHRDSPGKKTGVGCHALLQGIFPAQGRFWTLMHCRQILDPLSHQGSPLKR